MAGIVTGLAVALVLFAPASWLASTVTSRTEGRVQMGDPQGTLWDGSAQLILTGGPGSVDVLALPTRVQWTLRPTWTGIAVNVSTPCCAPQPVRMVAQPRLRGLTLKVADSHTSWPASLLSGLGTPWNTLQLEGELALETHGLSLEWVQGRLSVAGQAELKALRVSSRLSTLRPMGSYRITLSGGATPALQLETLDGALQLTGNGQWIGSRLRFTGSATAQPGSEEALANLLNIIGRRNGARSIIAIG